MVAALKRRIAVNWKATIRTMPVLGRLSYYIRPARKYLVGPVFLSSVQYWEDRYQLGGNSGAGSYNRLAKFKAEILNEFVEHHRIATVIEFGCGDGAQLDLAQYPVYVGVDVSETILTLVRQKFASDNRLRFIHTSQVGAELPADLSLSLDVIYHLVEDATFDEYMRDLFAFSCKYVIIYSSNEETKWSSPHVRHRRFVDWTEQNVPAFRLIKHIPNCFPYDVNDVDNTSFADFFIFKKAA
jgi:hypothetical protein